MMWPDLKETELYLRTGGAMTGAGCGSSPVRRSRSLSRTKKVGASVTPSVHLAVPDFSSVTSRRRSLATTWLEQGVLGPRVRAVWVLTGVTGDGRCLVAWTQSGARAVSLGSHQGTAVSVPTNTAREHQSDRIQMTPVETEVWDCWAGSRTVWTPFVRRGRGSFGSEPKEIVSSSLGSSVDFRVCHRGARSWTVGFPSTLRPAGRSTFHCVAISSM